MAAGLAVDVGGFAYLAVPTGCGRRGGYLPMPDLVTARAVQWMLRGVSGFRNVRLRESPSPDCCHVVEWGAPPPEREDDETQGRFYGYSADAIARYQAWQSAAPLI